MPPNVRVSQNGNASVPERASIGDIPYSQVKPSGSFTKSQNDLTTISYPSNWRVFPGADGAGLTIAPPVAISQGAIAYGVVIDSSQARGPISIDQATDQLVGALQQSNAGLRASASPSPFLSSMTEIVTLHKASRTDMLRNRHPWRDFFVCGLVRDQ